VPQWLGSAELETMDYLEFIARVVSHIPNKGQVMVRYHGLYANAQRGRVRKASGIPMALGMLAVFAAARADNPSSLTPVPPILTS